MNKNIREKKEIKNHFVELLFFIFSFFVSFFRSIKLFFSPKSKIKKENIFYMFLDYIFRVWPEYFWEKPSFYKIFSFPSNLLSYLFKK